MGVCERKGILVDKCLKAEYEARREANVNKPKKKKKPKVEDDEKEPNGHS